MVAYNLLSGIDAGLFLPAIGLFVVYQVAAMVYNLYVSPLAGIPGPWYAAVSDIWLLLHAAQFIQCNTLHALFEKYGPIVRVGPRRVVFCDRDAMKSVYCVNKLHKSTFYKALIADDHDHSMTSLTEMEHTMRRKTYAAHYSLSHISRFQADINDSVIRLVEALEISDRPSIDSIHLLRHLLVDVISQTVFGLEPLAIERWALHVEDPICSAVRDFPIRAILRSVMPDGLWKLLAYIPHPRWRELYHSDNVLAAFVRKRLRDIRAEAPTDVHLEDIDGPTPLMLRMLTQRSSSSGDALPEQDIVSECMSHLVAGVDTSSSTFGFMLWELSRRPDVVQRLRHELDEVIPERRTIPDHTVLLKQPYLTAFINEGFRMYGAVSSLLERVVPLQSEAHAPGVALDPFDIMGHSLPPGTVVGTQAWSMHRDPDVFPNPEFFDPERWLPGPLGNENKKEMERLARMGQYLIPFGAGTRACPGRYQAQLVFRATLAALVLNFDLVADARETNEETMAPRDAFAVRPASRECKLTFVPRPV